MSNVYTFKGSLTEYQEILSKSFYNEEDLERTVMTHLNAVLMDFYTIPFKAKIEDKINNRIKVADLAIIKKDFSEWYIVEVELSGHSLKHVSDQVESFFNCNYSDYHAKYISEKYPEEDNLDKIESMVNNHQPKLLVVVDKEKDEWKSKLDDFECGICVFQIYLNQEGGPAYRLSGEYPLSFTQNCFARIKKGILATVELIGNKGEEFCNSINLKSGDEVTIIFAGYKTKWQRVDDRTNIYLQATDGYFPLDPTTVRYTLLYNSSNNEIRFTKA